MGTMSRKYINKYRENNLEKRRKAERESFQKRYKKIKKNRKYNTPQVKARQALQYALRSGKIVKPLICQRCSITFKDHRMIHAHHKDYSKPLEVMWLCSVCHGLEHRQEQPLSNFRGATKEDKPNIHTCKCRGKHEVAITVRRLDEGLYQCPRCGGIIVGKASKSDEAGSVGEEIVEKFDIIADALVGNSPNILELIEQAKAETRQLLNRHKAGDHKQV